MRVSKFLPLAPLAVMACLSTPASADFYAGLVIGGGSGETEFDGFGTSTVDLDSSFRTVKLGYIMDSDNRFELSVTGIDVEQDNNGLEHEFSGLDLDFKVPFGESKLRPYVGVGMGFYSWEDTGHLFVDGEDLSGVAINLSAGGLLELHERFEVEAGLQYKAIAWQSYEVRGSSEEIDVSTSLTQLTLGGTFHF
ncbi:hypothetical protein CHH28_03930 [Bacterioplanes sanyensis]|uniref:Outer membrane protein beta-barrel domain-containing protein n=1 Tax=Bacterioplanes sanyensis TaxID=1249553 RepID=A0A222FHB6_9GAMM|nr:outer membrane beta-barrel protein [Bacterioplanes sanyensis]ASP37874.1 hypothetical protein CHH28_03930 [Bacterioplanes sanyensis]